MPLTAEHAEIGRLDATVITDEVWKQIHRRRAPLACRECSGRMNARLSTNGLRHFAHLPGERPEHCENYGESPKHLEGKRRAAEAVRAVDGWEAELEVIGDGWRADVLARGPDGRRVAIEVQLSTIHPEDAKERQRRHRASGVETLWLDLGNRIPREMRPVVVHGEDWTCEVARWAGHWVGKRVGLDVLLAAYCLGRMVWHEGDVLCRSYHSTPRTGWTAQRYVREAAGPERRARERAERQKASREAAAREAAERREAEREAAAQREAERQEVKRKVADSNAARLLAAEREAAARRESERESKAQREEFQRLRQEGVSLSDIVRSGALDHRQGYQRGTPALAWALVLRGLVPDDVHPDEALAEARSMWIDNTRTKVETKLRAWAACDEQWAVLLKPWWDHAKSCVTRVEDCPTCTRLMAELTRSHAEHAKSCGACAWRADEWAEDARLWAEHDDLTQRAVRRRADEDDQLAAAARVVTGILGGVPAASHLVVAP